MYKLNLTVHNLVRGLLCMKFLLKLLGSEPEAIIILSCLLSVKVTNIMEIKYQNTLSTFGIGKDNVINSVRADRN